MSSTPAPPNPSTPPTSAHCAIGTPSSSDLLQITDPVTSSTQNYTLLCNAQLSFSTLNLGLTLANTVFADIASTSSCVQTCVSANPGRLVGAANYAPATKICNCGFSVVGAGRVEGSEAALLRDAKFLDGIGGMGSQV